MAKSPASLLPLIAVLASIAAVGAVGAGQRAQHPEFIAMPNSDTWNLSAAADGRCPQILPGMDFQGNDFANAACSSLDECCARCQSNVPRCAAWTFNSQDRGGWCYLKIAAQNYRQFAGATTGQMPGPRPGPVHNDWLNPHNAARQAVNRGLPDLTWNDEQAAQAQQWADELRDTKNCGLEHNRYGQNLYWISVPGFTDYDKVVGDWVSEGYTCGSGVYNHCTQVLWKATTTVGCACSSGGCGTVCACDYDPIGNIVGEDPYPCN